MKKAGQQTLRLILLVLGLLCVGLGLLGIFLPLLPTTPFLLLAAALFARSSEKLHRWLHENRLFGEYLRRYRAGEGIPVRAKVVTLALLWLSLAYSAVRMSTHWSLNVLLLLIGLAVSVHLLRLPSYRKPPIQTDDPRA